MKPPEDYLDGTGRVCKLLNSIYGLIQLARCWNQRFTKFLKKYGSKAKLADPWVFTRINNTVRLILPIYIDNGIIAAKDRKMAHNLFKEVQRGFEIMQTSTNMFLRFKINQKREGSTFVHQAAYAKKMIDRFRIENTNAVTIPAHPNRELSPNGQFRDELEIPKSPYREVVGSSMYLSSSTRPDIIFAVNYVSRYLENPAVIHWSAVKRIFSYLMEETFNGGLLFRKGPDIHFKAHSDTHFAPKLGKMADYSHSECL